MVHPGGAQSGICLQLLRRHKTVCCTWVLLKIEDSLRKFLQQLQQIRVSICSLYILQLVRRQTVCKLGDAEEDWGTSFCISFRTGLNILLSAAVNLIFFWGFFWVDIVGFSCNILNFRLFVFLTSCKQIGHCVDYVLSKFCPSLYLRPKNGDKQSWEKKLHVGTGSSACAQCVLIKFSSHSLLQQSPK
jgi:hypothetical protein